MARRTFTSSRGGFVAPNGRTVVAFSREDVGPGATPKIVVAAFDDGSYEGAGPEFDLWLAARRERAEELGYWVKTLMSAPRVSPYRISLKCNF